MARPVNADASATRQRILDAALHLLGESGATSSSIREIARRAGVSVAMIHHYFGSKDELYEACIDMMYEQVGRMREALTEAFATERDLSGLVDRAVRIGFRFGRDHQPEVRLLNRLVTEAGGLDPRRQASQLLPLLDAASRGLAEQLGGEAAQYRLRVQSVVFLISRYAVSSEEELMVITAAESSAAAIQRVETHLVEVAGCLLAIGEVP